MPDTFPKQRSTNVPGVHWCVEPKSGEVVQLVTVMPDGLIVAWGTCVSCNNAASRCICTGGILNPGSVEWIYIRTLMQQDGVDVQGQITKDHHEVTARGLHWYRAKPTGGQSTFRMPEHRAKPAKPSAATSAPPAKAAPAPAKRSLKRKADVEKNYDNEASTKAAAATERLTRKLLGGDKPKRRLSRKV